MADFHRKCSKFCTNSSIVTPIPIYNFRGKVVCDDIVCPKPNCVKPFLPEGTCCPVCNETQISTNTGSGIGCFLEGDQVLHTPGSRWHPYIPPFGFSRCATCTCMVSEIICYV